MPAILRERIEASPNSEGVLRVSKIDLLGRRIMLDPDQSFGYAVVGDQFSPFMKGPGSKGLSSVLAVQPLGYQEEHFR